MDRVNVIDIGVDLVDVDLVDIDLVDVDFDAGKKSSFDALDGLSRPD